MILAREISPAALGAMLYRINFPDRDFLQLPTTVQQAYELDALRLLQMLDPLWRP
jgi:hypothetical protein